LGLSEHLGEDKQLRWQLETLTKQQINRTIRRAPVVMKLFLGKVKITLIHLKIQIIDRKNIFQLIIFPAILGFIPHFYRIN
jgi:hypothetical protein